MADESQPGAEDTRRFHIQRVYLKDVSFESPATPDIFAAGGDWQPEIGFELGTEQRQCAEGVYEVVLSVTVTATHGERTVFLVELKQAGLFEVRGFDTHEFRHVLGSYCVGILYPYARSAIADLVFKGGLPQVVLQPLNFDALYAEQQAQQNADGAAPDPAPDPTPGSTQ